MREQHSVAAASSGGQRRDDFGQAWRVTLRLGFRPDQRYGFGGVADVMAGQAEEFGIEPRHANFA